MKKTIETVREYHIKKANEAKQNYEGSGIARYKRELDKHMDIVDICELALKQYDEENSILSRERLRHFNQWESVLKDLQDTERALPNKLYTTEEVKKMLEKLY